MGARKRRNKKSALAVLFQFSPKYMPRWAHRNYPYHQDKIVCTGEADSGTRGVWGSVVTADFLRLHQNTVSNGRNITSHCKKMIYKYNFDPRPTPQNRRYRSGLVQNGGIGNGGIYRGSHICISYYNQEKTYLGLENQQRYWGGSWRRSTEGGIYWGDDCILK